MESTRDRLLEVLKVEGPQTAADLAEALGVTPMAVRQHAAVLLAEGVLKQTDRKRKVGRPVRVYSLTDEAWSRFADRHEGLTLALLESAREVFGEDGLARLVADRTRRQLALYRTRLPGPDAPLAERVAALARIRTEEGYMADWTDDGGGRCTLIENHCPIRTAAHACHGLCAGELELFRAALGPDAHVERDEHILDGARRCAYAITRARGDPRP